MSPFNSSQGKVSEFRPGDSKPSKFRPHVNYTAQLVRDAFECQSRRNSTVW